MAELHQSFFHFTLSGYKKNPYYARKEWSIPHIDRRPDFLYYIEHVKSIFSATTTSSQEAIIVIKNILCIGFYGNEIAPLLGALIRKSLLDAAHNQTRFFIKCVGIDKTSEREYPPRGSFYATINRLGFYPTRTPKDPAIMREAARRGLIPLYYCPTSIQRVKHLNMFDTFITPYLSVFEKMRDRACVQDKELLLVCHPNGIKMSSSPEDAAERMLPWVKNHFGSRQ